MEFGLLNFLLILSCIVSRETDFLKVFLSTNMQYPIRPARRNFLISSCVLNQTFWCSYFILQHVRPYNVGEFISVILRSSLFFAYTVLNYVV